LHIDYANCLKPAADAVIWRYMDLRKFRDLMASEELYFRRADLFTDKSEGLPPEDYAMRVLGLDPYDIRDRGALNNHLGSLAQASRVVLHRLLVSLRSRDQSILSITNWLHH
jgi:hypothetical protein